MEYKSFLHILVLGSASNSTSSGQIPDVETTKKFILDHPALSVYFYFIDPNHRSQEEDLVKFSHLIDAEIPLTIIFQPFLHSELGKNFKIFPEDLVLLIDYAGIATCEQEWTDLIGYKKQWYFWVPGCYGKCLNLEEAWNAANSWIPHNIYSKNKVPESLSKNHKQYLLAELDKLLLYCRVLPEDEKDPDPPIWLKERDALITGSDRATLISIRKSAELAVHDFMSNNDIEMWKHSPKMWNSIVRQILKLV